MSTHSRDLFTEAVGLHQAGQPAAAARLYQLCLERDPDHIDATHLLGVAFHELGQAEAAARLIGRAVTLRPDSAVFRATLAEAYRALGRYDVVVECCLAAIQLGLNDAAVYNNLGLALETLGQHREAVQAFRAALELRGDDAMVHTNLGTVLRALDEREQALDHFRRAVAIDPNLAAAQTNLGQLLLDLGRAELALPHCQQAVNLEPNLPEAHNNLGNALRVLGRFAEAGACYREAIRLRPTLTQAYVNLGQTLQQQGEWDEALHWLREASEIEPASLVYLALVAEAAVERELFDEAIGCYRKMLEIDSSLAATHNALGWLLQEAGHLTESEKHLNESLALRPDFAIAHVNLGGIREKLGDFAAAENSFRLAVSDEKSRSPALARLAVLLRGKLPDAELKMIEDYLASALPTDPTRVNLLFGLTSVWDGRGEYARAAACAREANLQARAELERRNRSYRPDEHEGLISGLIQSLDRGFFERLARAGQKTGRPVFIVGLPRSGTTLIEQILASHPQVFGAGELTFARNDFEAIPGLLGREHETPVRCIGDLSEEVIGRLGESHDRLLAELDGGRSARVVDKMPDNYVHLGLMAALFPARHLSTAAATFEISPFRAG